VALSENGAVGPIRKKEKQGWNSPTIFGFKAGILAIVCKV